MRWSKYFIPTQKENPQEAIIKSHRLMIRAGLIRKLASGTYSYLPSGLRALQKASEIIREEMNAAGCLEVLLPALHPVDLWKETGRFEILGEDMIRFKDRHGKENVLGPTHEEIITDLARKEIRSYKQLPVCFFQIQTKFRDEMRPRSGVIRSREFIMKDAYSFHETAESLEETYQAMKRCYEKIFSRCGLDYHVVDADPGAMGGSGSQEFVLFSDAGEDRMVQLRDSNKVVSIEMASRKLRGLELPISAGQKKYKKVMTPGHSSVSGVAAFLKKDPSELVKTMIYQSKREGLFAVLVRGDHEVSEFKIKKLCPGAVLASADSIDQTGSAFGYSGPLGLGDMPFYMDEDVATMKDFVVGANEDQAHLVDVNLDDIVSENRNRKIILGDFRQALEGDRGPHGEELLFKTAIELGHIFKLNRRYSEPLKASYLDAEGHEQAALMGCYGIGVNRILAAAIEQHADEKGIIWPKNISPFQVLILMLDPKDTDALDLAQGIENSHKLKSLGIDVLVDDRPDTAGIKFNDADLIGIPMRVVLGSKNLKVGKVEIKIRKTSEVILVDKSEVIDKIPELLDKIS